MLKTLHLVRTRPVLTVAISLALLIAAWFAWGVLSPSRDPQIEGLRRRGIPVTLQELNDFYPAVDPKHNSALAYAECFSTPLFQPANTKDQTARKWLPTRGQTFGEDATQEMSLLLSTNQQVFRKLHQATGPARYPIDLRDGPEAVMPHLSKIKTGVSLLSSEALFQAGNKDSEAAMETLLAAQRLADSLLLEPLVVSCLVRYDSINIMLRRLERVMSLVPLSDAQLLRLEVSLARAETNAHLVRALAGETALGLGCFHESRHAGWILSGRSSVQPTLSESLRNTAGLSSLKITGFFAKDRRFFLNSMSARMAAAELPFPQRFVSGLNPAANRLPSQFMIFSRMLLPRFGNLTEQDTRNIALLRAARTAIAIERFRLAHQGRMPDELKNLVPDFLSSIAQDPFTGAPLHYVPEASKYTVYSVNSDLRDDGGLEVEPNVSGPSDLIFSIIPPVSDRPL
jgi:hypothetical protein